MHQTHIQLPLPCRPISPDDTLNGIVQAGHLDGNGRWMTVVVDPERATSVLLANKLPLQTSEVDEVVLMVFTWLDEISWTWRGSDGKYLGSIQRTRVTQRTEP